MSDRRVNNSGTRMAVITYNSEEELTAKLRAMLHVREEWVTVTTLSERYNLLPDAINKRIQRWRTAGTLLPERDLELTKDGCTRLVRVTPFLREKLGSMRRYKRRRQ